MPYTTSELVSLAGDLVAAANERGVTLRLLGGVAAYLNSPKARELPQFTRVYKDLDFVLGKRGASRVDEVFTHLGWAADQQFNALHGATRMLFYYGGGELQVDVFVGVFEQCHTLTFAKRLDLASPTIPLAELLMTKLQIQEPNRKDVQDTVMLLYDHDFGCSDASEQGYFDYVVDVAKSDWGWYTTLMDNLAFVRSMAGEFVTGADLDRIVATIDWMRTSLESAPKSLKWNARNAIGRRMQWYELPEEVDR